MLEYRAEGLCRNANHLRREELYHCITTGEVLQSTALAFIPSAACALSWAASGPTCPLRNVWMSARRRRSRILPC